MANSLDKLFGQETELAIRFEAEDVHPGNKLIFRCISESVQSFVKTRPGKRNWVQEQLFVENGGAFYYEHHPQKPSAGLLEFSTPECTSSKELILYQRAMEKLMVRALPLAEQLLKKQGFPGQLSLIKNSRDFFGNTYGCQENYDAQVASGWRLYLLRIFLLLFLPISLLMKFVYLAAIIPFALLVLFIQIPVELLAVVLEPLRSRLKIGLHERLDSLRSWLNFDEPGALDLLVKIEYYVALVLFVINYKPLIYIWNYFAFRQQQSKLEAFILSRMVFSGAGCLFSQDQFRLSERAEALSGKLRSSVHRLDKPVFDCGHLIKEFELAVWDLFLLRVSSLPGVFKSRQRLQVSFSDSNRCSIAEYLKLGVTGLLVEMSDKGLLNSAPRISNARQAVQSISSIESWQHPIRVNIDGQECEMNALEIQRWYIKEVKEYLSSSTVSSIEAKELVDAWVEVIDQLEKAPEKLLGRIDWVSKRYLLEQLGSEASFEQKKKLDIRYHELGSGYFDLLKSKGISYEFFSESEVENAVHNASSSRRAQMRSSYIKSISLAQEPMSVSWRQVRIGRWKPRLVDLSENKDPGMQE